ncbi:MAG: class I SAM-dependent methyltransferase [Bacillaceae bacterium]
MNEWNEKLKTRWDEEAYNWHTHSESMWTSGSRRDILPFIKPYIKENNTVLDAGCGPGYSSYRISQWNVNVIGIDFSPEMIQLANKSYQNPLLTFSVGDLSHLSFDDESFDFIICINSIEWTPNPLLVIKELQRILKKSGKICISLLGPTAAPRKNSYERLYGHTAICNTMMPWELEQLMTEHHFHLLKEQGIYGKIPTELISSIPKKHQQALAFSWLSLFEK